MKQYHDLVQDILDNGCQRDDRTGVGTLSVFGRELRFNRIGSRFPILASKETKWKTVVRELLWMLSGSTNTRDLKAGIWDEWASEGGDLGPIYGEQWRAWNAAGGRVDQIAKVVSSIRNNPHSRRHLVSAWNVGDLDMMALHPCHVLFQFYVDHKDRLSCQVYQRSADVFLGLPFNIASYALLTTMVAHVTGLRPGDLIHTLGDAHLYLNHFNQAKTLLKRRPMDGSAGQRPVVRIDRDTVDIFSITEEDISLLGYNPLSPIPAPIAV